MRRAPHTALSTICLPTTLPCNAPTLCEVRCGDLDRAVDSDATLSDGRRNKRTPEVTCREKFHIWGLGRKCRTSDVQSGRSEARRRKTPASRRLNSTGEMPCRGRYRCGCGLGAVHNESSCGEHMAIASGPTPSPTHPAASICD